MSNFDPKTPFTPTTPSKDQLEEITSTLAKEVLGARIAIAELKGYVAGEATGSTGLMNPLYLKEALSSSEIENINTTLMAVFQDKADMSPKRNSPTSEVINYYQASLEGQQLMRKYGIISRLVTDIQHILLPREKGFRKNQVIIADGRGAARYTPPEAQKIPSLIAKWEKMINADYKKVDPLVISAVGHYLFEAIHPFNDGNGRTGRMLINLDLMHKGLIDLPIIHISHFINNYRSEYYNHLRDISETDNYLPFVKYMLSGFALQAKRAHDILVKQKELQNRISDKLTTEAPGIYSSELCAAVISSPVQTATSLSKELGVHRVTAVKYLSRMAELGIMTKSKVGRSVYFVNHELLKMLEEQGRKFS